MASFDKDSGTTSATSNLESPIEKVLIELVRGKGGETGSISALLGRFERAGLGHLVESWIGEGPNRPVSPQELRKVLGEDEVEDLASQSGLPEQDLLGQLSRYLPPLIDHLTGSRDASAPPPRSGPRRGGSR